MQPSQAIMAHVIDSPCNKGLPKPFEAIRSRTCHQAPACGCSMFGAQAWRFHSAGFTPDSDAPPCSEVGATSSSWIRVWICASGRPPLLEGRDSERC